MVDTKENALLQYLPERFREDQATVDFLLAFEKILLGRADTVTDAQGHNPQGIEQTLDQLARYFTPGDIDCDSDSDSVEKSTPDDFLPWLSQWVALSLRTDINDSSVPKYECKNNKILRQFIAEMPKLYKQRGTKDAMKKLLGIFTGVAAENITVVDQIDGKPHFFKVVLKLGAFKDKANNKPYERAKELAHSVILLEKPAHTYYLLIPSFKTMQIGNRNVPPPNGTSYYIKIGDNTRLGDSHSD